jgi:hypothetical protein
VSVHAIHAIIGPAIIGAIRPDPASAEVIGTASLAIATMTAIGLSVLVIQLTTETIATMSASVDTVQAKTTPNPPSRRPSRTNLLS